jgi:hypothetical protein
MTGRAQPNATLACAALLLAAPAWACYCLPRSPSEQSYTRKFEEAVRLGPLCPDLLRGLLLEADDDLRLSGHPSAIAEGPAGMPRFPVPAGGPDIESMPDIDSALLACQARIAAGKAANAPPAH